MNTWKALLTQEDEENGFDVFALPRDLISAVEGLLEENDLTESFDVSVLSGERKIYHWKCSSTNEAIEKLDAIRIDTGILAVRCRVSSIGTAIVADVEEISKY